YSLISALRNEAMFSLSTSRTMKKLLASLLAFVGLASGATPEQQGQTVNPKSILFTTPTLSDDIAPLAPVSKKPSDTDFVFHEDEWSQVEFYAKDRIPEIQRLLREYKPYEQTQRAQYGWRNVYVRKIQRTSILSG